MDRAGGDGSGGEGEAYGGKGREDEANLRGEQGAEMACGGANVSAIFQFSP